jgi:uncharacterized coiled-coil protein SlyX
MTELELRIADLELRIGDIDLTLALGGSGRVTLGSLQILDLDDQRRRLTEELQCLKQSVKKGVDNAS